MQAKKGDHDNFIIRFKGEGDAVSASARVCFFVLWIHGYMYHNKKTPSYL